MIRKENSNSNFNGQVWDAPCGNGLFAYLTHRQLKHIKFSLLDNDEEVQNSPYLKNQSENFSFKLGDIFENQLEGTENIWLLINSLYCLPDIETLITNQKTHFKTVIGIFPNINAFNFKYFKKHKPKFFNPNLMSIPDTIKFFQNLGYLSKYHKSITKIPFHFWGNFFEKIHLPIVVRNIVFTCLDKLLFFKRGQYMVIVFSRYE